MKRKYNNRRKEIELPIIYEESNIIEELNENDIIIICGETGCGKSTKIPQFLLNNGYSNKESINEYKRGIIGITEPRRIAAIGMSLRVSKELELKNEISYHVRYENNVNNETRIKFMTDGILMKELEDDFKLSKYSVIIIDEAHERSLYTDILIGMLSRIVALRRKEGKILKWIIMSATLCINELIDNTKLFNIKPKIINIKSRQYPVEIKFSKETPSDYLQECINIMNKILCKKDKGNILIFVSTQYEVKYLCNLISNTFNNIDIFPLYAMLSLEEQCKVLDISNADNIRKCIVSTNVAETSLTINGIKYIVDTGKVKSKIYDKLTGIEKYEINWCSKASAEQRSGRAGRVGPGICYRLYSSSVYNNDFDDFTQPEILVRNLQNIILQLKCMGISNIKNFPFPTPPNINDIKNCEEILLKIGALNKISYNVTNYGYMLNCIPLLPIYSKIIIDSFNTKCTYYILIITCVLSIRELFIFNDDNKNNYKKVRKERFMGKTPIDRKLGDLSIILNIIYKCYTSSNIEEFCNTYGIYIKSIYELFKLIEFIKNIIEFKFNLKLILTKPSVIHYEIIRKLFVNCFSSNIAKRISVDNNIYYECNSISKRLLIHYNSVLYGKNPEYVLFNQLCQSNSNIYMKNLCVVDSEWIVN